MLRNLQLGAKVESSEGENLGDVKYLIADPRTNEITHLVVDRSGIDARQIVVEVSRVEEVASDGGLIHLALTESQLNGLPDFIEREYVNVGAPYGASANPNDSTTDVTTPDGDVYGAGSGVTATSGFLYPGSDAGLVGPFAAGPGLVGPNAAAGSNAFAPVYSDLDNPVGVPYEEKLNVPEGSLVIKEGANVFAQDGKVGKVARVNYDSGTAQIVSFVVEKGFIFTQDVTIPVEMVESATTDEVTLSVSKDEAQNAGSYDQTGSGDYQPGTA